MAAIPKVSAREKQKAVDRILSREATVRHEAKRLGVSEPAVYQWLTKAKIEMVSAAQTDHMSPQQLNQHEKLNLKVQLEMANKKISELESTIAQMTVEMYRRKDQ